MGEAIGSLSAELEHQTDLLIGSIDQMDEASVTAPSLLPNWSRGHVLAHIEGNARGLERLVRSAIDGNHRPMYTSREVRDSDIDLNAQRSLVRHRESILESVRALAEATAQLGEEQQGALVVLGTGSEVRAGSLTRLRLQEVCIHHVDLDVGFAPSQWPVTMVERLLPQVLIDLGGTGGFAPEGVSGPDSAMLAWLLGRSDGTDLDVTGAQELPEVPRWR